MRSGIYRGVVRHTRSGPREHSFRYRVHMFALDLEELPTAFDGRWLWSVERPNVFGYRRRDYLGDVRAPLEAAVRERVAEHLDRRPEGPITLVTQLRTFGYVFNPVSFYLCYDKTAEHLDAIVAEITNTPWGERHAYVLDAAEARSEELASEYCFRFDKDFHVSPIFDLNQVYEWRFRLQQERFTVSMTNHEGGEPVFYAGFDGHRRPLTGRELARAAMLQPLQPLRMHAAIYWQAARLWMKRTPFFTHPKKRIAQDASTS